jgi:hypothetical protein
MPTDQITHCNDNTHTQAVDVLVQPGATIAATAKPEKKNKDVSSLARSDIWCMRGVELDGTWHRAKTNR